MPSVYTILKSHDPGIQYERPTIGFGHLIKPGERFKEPLLGDAAERLLLHDVKPKAAAVNAQVLEPLFQG